MSNTFQAVIVFIRSPPDSIFCLLSRSFLILTPLFRHVRQVSQSQHLPQPLQDCATVSLLYRLKLLYHPSFSCFLPLPDTEYCTTLAEKQVLGHQIQEWRHPFSSNTVLPNNFLFYLREGYQDLLVIHLVKCMDPLLDLFQKSRCYPLEHVW